MTNDSEVQSTQCGRQREILRLRAQDDEGCWSRHSGRRWTLTARTIARIVRRKHLAAWVYILTNRSGTLDTGVTSNLERRVWEHKQHRIPGFTQCYRIDRLVWFEETPSVRDAIAREKQIKGWIRAKKVEVIVAENPEWIDLSEGWFGADAQGTFIPSGRPEANPR